MRVFETAFSRVTISIYLDLADSGAHAALGHAVQQPKFSSSPSRMTMIFHLAQDIFTARLLAMAQSGWSPAPGLAYCTLYRLDFLVVWFFEQRAHVGDTRCCSPSIPVRPQIAP